jgi:hypothetical protein
VVAEIAPDVPPPAVPVALAITVRKPGAFRLLAVMLCVPTNPPSVHVVCAMPLALVVALVGLTDPPPAAGLKSTTAPATGTPSDATAFTTIESASALVIAPVCPPPETSCIPDAPSATFTVTVSVGAAPPWT